MVVNLKSFSEEGLYSYIAIYSFFFLLPLQLGELSPMNVEYLARAHIASSPPFWLLPGLQRVALKSWEWPGGEATNHVHVLHGVQ